MRKYILPIAAFVFFVASFFVFTPQQNLVWALNAGQTCQIAQGCGKSTLVCVPDGKICNTGIVSQSCGTGVCETKTATSGSCQKDASVCDASKGYSCQQDAHQSDPQCGVPLHAPCTFSCQSNKVKEGGTCQGSGQGNCASSSDVCLPDQNQCQTVIGNRVCTNTCQPKKVNTGGICSGSGQGNCASSGDVCQEDPNKCQTILGTKRCDTTCQTKKVKTGGTCQGSGQGNCASSNDECIPDPKSCQNVIGQQVCSKYVCTTKKQKNNTCSTDGDCTAGLVCLPIQSTCKNVFGQQVCDKTCQPPQQPTGAPTIPPPPSPPCQSWAGGQCQTFQTSFGSFPTDPSGFIEKIFAILLSVSGGIAALLIIRAGYQLMTSQGKPEQLQNGRDQLIAAIVGLVFLIFSFALLQIIGFNILRLPGFNGPQNGPTCAPSSCIPQSVACGGNTGTKCIHTGCQTGFACPQP